MEFMEVKLTDIKSTDNYKNWIQMIDMNTLKGCDNCNIQYKNIYHILRYSAHKE